MMRVDPCRLKGINDLCCDGSNEAVCEDNTIITSGTDIGLAWFVNGFIMKCSEVYRDLGVCGTFIEIHKPNSHLVEESLEISITYSSGFSTEFISTKNLCAGRYEFWFVIRTRNGKILQYVKPFFSQYPSCTDEEIVNLREITFCNDNDVECLNKLEEEQARKESDAEAEAARQAAGEGLEEQVGNR